MSILTRRPSAAAADATGDQIAAARAGRLEQAKELGAAVDELNQRRGELANERRRLLVDQELDGVDHNGRLRLIVEQIAQVDDQLESKEAARLAAIEDADSLEQQEQVVRRQQNWTARMGNSADADAFLRDHFLPAMEAAERCRLEFAKFVQRDDDLRRNEHGRAPSGDPSPAMVEHTGFTTEGGVIAANVRVRRVLRPAS